MANAYTQVPADSTGDKIDTEELTVGANTVNRQRVQLAGTADTAIAPVTLADGLLVNLGTNNDVTVTSGTVTVGAALPAGTNNIGDVDILSIAAGDNNIGNVDIVTEPATAADAAAGLPAVVKVVGGYDGANVQAVKTNSDGSISINDNASTISVDDGAGSLTVDGTVAVSAISSALPAGTNNIGDVDVLSIAAGTNKIGVVGTDIVTPTDGGTALTVSFASVDVASSGDNTIVAAQGAGNAVRVLSYTLVASGGANTVTWKSGASTAKSGGMAFAANGGASATCNFGLFQTADNEALVLNLSAATSVDGHITYVVV